MFLKVYTVIRHRGCPGCSEVEQNYLDLSSSEDLMHTVGEVVQKQAQKAHGRVYVHNFSLAKWSDSDTDSWSSLTEAETASDEKQPAGKPSIEEAVADVPGSAAESAPGEEASARSPGETTVEDAEAAVAGAAAGGREDDARTTRSKPRRICDITAVVDWTTPANFKDMSDVDMLRLVDDECRELGAYMRSRGQSDLIVLEYSLEP